MLDEYVRTVHNHSYPCPMIPGAEIFAAYSEKEDKGKKFELRLPASGEADSKPPRVLFALNPLNLEKIKIKNQYYWIGYLDTKKHGISPEQIMEGQAPLELDETTPLIF